MGVDLNENKDVPVPQSKEEENTIILVEEDSYELKIQEKYILVKKISNTIQIISVINIVVSLFNLLLMDKTLSLLAITSVIGIIGVRLINHNISGLYLISILFCIFYRFYYIINNSIKISSDQFVDVNIILLYLLTIVLMSFNIMIESCLFRIIFIFCNKLKKLSKEEKKRIYKMRLSENSRYVYL